jgi:hypothetical protein
MGCLLDRNQRSLKGVYRGPLYARLKRSFPARLLPEVTALPTDQDRLQNEEEVTIDLLLLSIRSREPMPARPAAESPTRHFFFGAESESAFIKSFLDSTDLLSSRTVSTLPFAR